MRYYTRLILLAVSIGLTAPLSAQLVEVTLKNGHSLRGEYLPKKGCTGVRLTVLAGDTICVPFEQYAEIKFPRVPKAGKRSPTARSAAIPTSPLEAKLQKRNRKFSEPAAPVRGIYKRIGLSASLVRSRDDSPWRSAIQGSLWLEGGYQLNERLSVGLATGYDDLPVDQIPVLAIARWRTGSGINSYFVQGQLGYGFLADKVFRELTNPHWYKGGLAAYPAVGYEWATYRRTRWSIDVGYKYNQFRREVTRDDYFSRTKVDYERWTARVALRF